MFNKIRWFLASKLRRVLIVALGTISLFLAVLVSAGIFTLENLSMLFPRIEFFDRFKDSLSKTMNFDFDESFSLAQAQLFKFFGFEIHIVDTLNSKQERIKHQARINTLRKYDIRCYPINRVFSIKDKCFILVAAATDEDFNYLRLVGKDIF